VSTGHIPEHHPRRADVPATSKSGWRLRRSRALEPRPNPPGTKVRLSTGSNPWVRVPMGRYLYIPNPKPASAGFWRAGNPNLQV